MTHDWRTRCLNLDGEVHVWPIVLTVSKAVPDGVAAECRAVLAEEEVARAERFRFPHLLQSFVLAHGLLRILLARYLDVTPAQVPIGYGPRGKPKLTYPTSVQFNLSHSGTMALVAVANGFEVGVDIEQIRSFPDMAGIAARFFCEEEADELMSLPEDQRDLAFFLCWTRKEAYIKAVGDGLSVSLDSFRVKLRPGEPAGLVHLGRDPEAAARWTMHNLELASGYAAALAYNDAPRHVEVMPMLEPAELL